MVINIQFPFMVKFVMLLGFLKFFKKVVLHPHLHQFKYLLNANCKPALYWVWKRQKEISPKFFHYVLSYAFEK